MTINKIFVCILLLCFLPSCTFRPSLPEITLNFHVIDELGNPIEGAKIRIGFEVYGTNNGFHIEGLTDNNGVFVAKHNAAGSGFGVDKDGYYKSEGGAGHGLIPKTGKWLPANHEIKVVLRKIINPVPMYARDIHMSGIISKMEVPVVGKDVGFDLIEYAWMPPYGIGEHADFIFNLKRNFVDDKNFDCSLKIKFNKNDGIQEVKDDYSVSVVNKYNHHSEFKLVRNAPEAGYLNELTLPYRRGRGNTETKDNYVFRVRSKVVGGKVNGMYGKIHGDIMFDPRGSKTASILFKYYLNPDYTNNLEFDPKKNLFNELKSFEQVGL
jgi:hypothetical protein